jgi:hypothetical protein
MGRPPTPRLPVPKTAAHGAGLFEVLTCVPDVDVAGSSPVSCAALRRRAPPGGERSHGFVRGRFEPRPASDHGTGASPRPVPPMAGDPDWPSLDRCIGPTREVPVAKTQLGLRERCHEEGPEPARREPPIQALGMVEGQGEQHAGAQNHEHSQEPCRSDDVASSGQPGHPAGEGSKPDPEGCVHAFDTERLLGAPFPPLGRYLARTTVMAVRRAHAESAFPTHATKALHG